MALSNYATRESAVADVVELLQELLRCVEVLKGRVSWTEELEKSVGRGKRVLGALDVATTSRGESKRTDI
jgi:hypothetical protein